MSDSKVQGWAVSTILICGLMGGCMVTPVGRSPSGPVADGMRSGRSDAMHLKLFELKLRNRGLILEHNEQWADAAVNWEILTVIAPESVQYRLRHWQALRRRDEQARVLWKQVEASLARRDVSTARVQSYELLATDPEHAEARRVLKDLEARAAARALRQSPALVGGSARPRGQSSIWSEYSRAVSSSSP